MNASFAHADDNLLANGGFEEIAGTKPARWDVYLKAAEGASAKLAGEAHSGKCSVMIQVSAPYAEEPANNWSQNVIGDYGGKSLRLQGFIKVLAATDAAIWAQCWKKKPFGVISVASTGQRAPAYGTKDWDEVFVDFDVPANTDFITVRCVLKGTGTAWFDDVTLTETSATPKPTEVLPPPPPHTTELNPPMPTLPPPGMRESTKTPRKSTLGEQVREQLDAVRLKEENDLLKSTVESLKSSNEELKQRVKSLEDKGGAAKPEAEKSASP